MVKNFFVSLFFLVVFSFFVAPNINAQESSFLVPGINCGIAGDISTNKCCAPFSWDSIKNLADASPDFGSPWRVLRDLAYGAAKEFTKGLTDPIDEYQKKILVPCEIGTKSTDDPADINCRCLMTTTPTPGPIETLNKFCENQTSSNDKSNCGSCITGGGVWTGIGCVQGSVSGFVGQTVFGWGIGLAGGFSLLCIIYAAFMMQSSEKKKEKLKKAQEMITSCIMGLMLIIFSVFILKLIGVNILKIPGFN